MTTPVLPTFVSSNFVVVVAVVLVVLVAAVVIGDGCRRDLLNCATDGGPTTDVDPTTRTTPNKFARLAHALTTVCNQTHPNNSRLRWLLMQRYKADYSFQTNTHKQLNAVVVADGTVQIFFAAGGRVVKRVSNNHENGDWLSLPHFCLQ